MNRRHEPTSILNDARRSVALTAVLLAAFALHIYLIGDQNIWWARPTTRRPPRPSGLGMTANRWKEGIQPRSGLLVRPSLTATCSHWTHTPLLATTGWK